MTASTTPKSNQRAAHDRLKTIRRTRTAKPRANGRRRPDASREELRRPDSPEAQLTTPEESRALWAMTRDERIAAMWRSRLTIRQLCQWSSRAQHEVPLLGGEFAWIAMRTPEWAEASNKLATAHVPQGEPGGQPMTIALSTIGCRSVTLTVSRSVLDEAPDGVAIKLTLHDGPLVLTLTRDEARALDAELAEQLAEPREAP